MQQSRKTAFDDISIKEGIKCCEQGMKNNERKTMNENKCPYCHETADECESVKLLFIDEKFKKSTYDYVAQAWIWLDRLHFEVIVPMLDYHIPRFEFFKNIKINYCPMCGRKLIVAERRKTATKERVNEASKVFKDFRKGGH